MGRQKKKVLLGASALILAVAERRRRRRLNRKRPWTREWIKKRRQHGAYHCLMRELKISDKQGYKNFLRMDEQSFEELLAKVKPLIQKQDTVMRTSISPGERLALTLRYLSTGDSYTSLQYLYWVPKQTISCIVPEVCKAIHLALKDEYLKMPSTTEEWQAIAQQFYERWNFVNCIGAIDGKHVVVQAPINSGSYYFNYKGTFSIVLLAVVDADYKFTYVDVGCNGRISDGGVFKNSTLSEALESNTLNIPSDCELPGTTATVPYAFVGDDAFPLKPYILKPYSQRGLTKEKRVFNYRLSRARRIVENGFGILANRFRVFMKPIALEPSKVEDVVLATVSLHNFLRSKSGTRAIYTPAGSFDVEDTDAGPVLPGSWRNDGEPRGLIPIAREVRGRLSVQSQDHRNVLCNYFNSQQGAVPWQWRVIEGQ